MSKLKVVFIFLIFSSLVFSCKTKRKLQKNESTQLLQIYDSIVNKYIDYETLLIKSSIKYENVKRKLNLKATVKLKKDSLIIISLSPGLGIELARIKFTMDSIFVLDRLSSQLTRGDYQFIEKTYKINITYADIQSILTNQLFIYPRNHNSLEDEFVKGFHFGTGSKRLDIYRKTDNSVENLISLDEQTYFVKKYIINDIPNKRNLSILFEDTYSDELKSLPKRVSITSSVDGKFNRIKLNYSKVSKNKKFNFSFKVPSKYKIIDFKK